MTALGQLSLYDSQVLNAPHNGTPTSIAAAVAAMVKVTPQSRRILGQLGMGPMTQDEMSIALWLPRSTACARFNELERDLLIEKTNETRPTQYGKAAVVYRLKAPLSAPARSEPDLTRNEDPRRDKTNRPNAGEGAGGSKEVSGEQGKHTANR